MAAAIRLVLIYYGRHTPGAGPGAGPSRVVEQPTALDPDYYVISKKLYAYDLKTARAGLVGHPAWVREGYKFTYFPYDARRHQPQFNRPAGLLMPLQQLYLRDIVQAPPPAAGDLPQVMAVFEQGGQEFAVPIGARRGEEYIIYADEMLFLEDPHQLYQHWKPEVWQAIERHQVQPGMNEIQASFALGMGVPKTAADAPEKIVVYPNAGNETTVIFRNGRAAEIHPASTSPAR